MATITYNDKTALTIDTSIADENKVTASDLNEIKNVVNTNASTLDSNVTQTATNTTNLTNLLNIFSGSEVNTGMTYVDGSTIYAKAVNIGTLSAQSGTYTHGIGFSRLVMVTGSFYTNAGYWEYIPYWYTSYNGLFYDITTTTIRYKFDDNMWSRNPSNIVLIFLYTK